MNPDNADVQAFFAALPDTEVPDNVRNGIDNSLLSVQTALDNHPTIGAAYKAIALNAVDKNIGELLEEYQFPDDYKKEVLSEGSTYKRINLLAKKLVDLQGKKAAGSSGKAETANEINTLNEQIRQAKADLAAAQAQHKDDIKKIELGRYRDRYVSGLRTKYDNDPVEVKEAAINALLSKRLQETGTIYSFDDHNNFVIRKSDGSNYVDESHKPVDAKAFIESALSPIIVTNNGPTGNNFNPPARTGNNNNGGTPATKVQSGILAANKAALKNLEQSDFKQ